MKSYRNSHLSHALASASEPGKGFWQIVGKEKSWYSGKTQGLLLRKVEVILSFKRECPWWKKKSDKFEMHLLAVIDSHDLLVSKQIKC